MKRAASEATCKSPVAAVTQIWPTKSVTLRQQLAQKLSQISQDAGKKRKSCTMLPVPGRELCASDNVTWRYREMTVQGEALRHIPSLAWGHPCNANCLEVVQRL